MFCSFLSPSATDTAHAYTECSSKGMCNRVSGECECFPGYEGKGCQRNSCPNQCSGKGTCRYVHSLSLSVGFSICICFFLLVSPLSLPTLFTLSHILSLPLSSPLFSLTVTWRSCLSRTEEQWWTMITCRPITSGILASSRCDHSPRLSSLITSSLISASLLLFPLLFSDNLFSSLITSSLIPCL